MFPDKIIPTPLYSPSSSCRSPHPRWSHTVMAHVGACISFHPSTYSYVDKLWFHLGATQIYLPMVKAKSISSKPTWNINILVAKVIEETTTNGRNWKEFKVITKKKANGLNWKEPRIDSSPPTQKDWVAQICWVNNDSDRRCSFHKKSRQPQ